MTTAATAAIAAAALVLCLLLHSTAAQRTGALSDSTTAIEDVEIFRSRGSRGGVASDSEGSTTSSRGGSPALACRRRLLLGGGGGCGSGGAGGARRGKTISHRYTVSLRRRSDSGYFCAGVLVSKRHVLTAAHCVDSSRSFTDSKPMVVIGSSSSSKTSGNGVQVIPTKRVVLHPNYLSQRVPDLAILELHSDANETPVRLPERFLPTNGVTLQSIGWGRQSTGSAHAETVQVASMDFIPRKSCRPRIGTSVFKHQICMGGDSVGTCKGDDGGPIVLPGSTRSGDILVGIVGGTHACGRLGRPDVHTNIFPFKDWIASTAGLS